MRLQVVDHTALERVAVQAALELASGKLQPTAATRKPSVMQWLLERNPIGRRVLFDQAAKAVDKATGGHYPSPPAILDAVRTGLEEGMAAGLAKEAKLFGQLGMTPQSAALRGLFFAQTATKKNPYKVEAGAAFREAKTVGVLGAGLMGAGISQVTASAGKLEDGKHIERPPQSRRRRCGDYDVGFFSLSTFDDVTSTSQHDETSR